jgi:pimeloyl-ACP methyl ester carboxylesterase
MKIAAKIAAGILAALVLVVVVFVAATFAPDRTVSELQARWAPAPSVFLDVVGMKVHLRDEGPRGDPCPIILIHGTSSSLHTWEGWVHSLKGQRRTISFDLPGFGLTGPSPDGDYTIASYVRFMKAMLDRLGIRHCVLAGNSFGGWVAWETALSLPERIDKLILVDANGYPRNSTSIPIGFRVARIPVLNRLLDVTLPRHIVASSVREVYGDPRRVTPELVDRYYEITLRAGNRHALAERFKQAQPGQDAYRIRELKLPTLILWGGRDRLIPPDNAARFHHDIALSRLVIFDTLGHVPQEEDPVRTAAAVKKFLDIK